MHKLLIALLGLVIVSVALGTQPIDAAFPGVNGKIAFTSYRDGNYEIYVMHADGSRQSTLTNNPTTDFTFPNDIGPTGSARTCLRHSRR